MSVKKIGFTAAAVAAAGGLAFGGASLATAANAPAGSTSSSTAPADGQRGPGGGHHTEVTGDEATKVSDAVTAKDSAVTVEKVLKDEDGSYDVAGTKDGNRIMFEVSADLATVTERTGGPGGHGGGPGWRGGHPTEVTGDQATKVSDAVTAKDSAVTVEKVLKDEDGSYDVLGTKDGNRIRFEVSADLGTVTERAGGPGHRPGGAAPGGSAPAPDQDAPGQEVQPSSTTTS